MLLSASHIGALHLSVVSLSFKCYPVKIYVMNLIYVHSRTWGVKAKGFYLLLYSIALRTLLLSPPPSPGISCNILLIYRIMGFYMYLYDGLGCTIYISFCHAFGYTYTFNFVFFWFSFIISFCYKGFIIFLFIVFTLRT